MLITTFSAGVLPHARYHVQFRMARDKLVSHASDSGGAWSATQRIALKRSGAMRRSLLQRARGF
jgi:hypothetical protein